MMFVLDAITKPRQRAAAEIIAQTEVVRTSSADTSVFQQKILALRAIIAESPFKTTESIEKLTEVLKAVRQIVDLELLTASRQWRLTEHVAALEAARGDLLDFHLNPDFQAKAETVARDAATKTDFPIELVRDVAKYLDKLGKLTQDVSYHVLAAEILTVATSEVEKNLSMGDRITPNSKHEGYFLAHLERLIQLDLSESEIVDPDMLMLYGHILAAQDQKEGEIQNWDRQAAIGWMLFEFGMRRAVPEAIAYGMSRVSAATKASGGAQTCMRYCAKRLVAKLAEQHRSGEFQVAAAQTQAQIRQKLDLPQKET